MFGRGTALPITALAFGFSIAVSAHAQTAPAGAGYQQAFEAMMSDLGNPAKSFAFVEAAVAAGDIRGAIAALERILLIQPDLPNIKAELGYLYLRAGAPETAATYLDEARASGEIPPEVQTRIEEIAQSAEAEQSRHAFSGSVYVAGQHETNANAGPDSLGLDEGDGEADFSIAGSGSLTHAYDFGYQDGRALITELNLYAVRYAEVSSSNVAFARLGTGPRLVFGPADDPVRVRPFVFGSALSLDDENYREELGLGVEADKGFAYGVLGDIEAGLTWQKFDNSPENDDATNRDGVEAVLDSGVAWQFRDDLILSVRADGTRKSADKGFESYWEGGGLVGLTWLYLGPVPAGVDRSWIFTSSAALHRAVYDDGEFELIEDSGTGVPVVRKSSDRKDTRLDLRLGLAVPLAAQFDGVANLGYTDNNSTSETDEFDNFSIALGVQWRF